LAAQSKYVNMTQEAIKPRKQAKQNGDDSLANSKANLSEIWSKLKTRIKTEMEYEKWYYKKWKQQKQSEFQKSTQTKPVYEELSLNLEPNVNDV
jgi:high-affinity Fe2+/Pb2+ permease